MRTWADVVLAVVAQPVRTHWAVPKTDLPAGPPAGFRTASGWPCGQSADYRLTLTDGRSVHAQDMGNAWHVHVDVLDPDVDALGHITADLPMVALVAAPVLGGVLTHFVFGNWKSGALAGAAVAVEAVNRKRSR